MKIKNILIESFRGIPNTLNINFSDKNENPISTLIYGDNGTGKSSITDALEFNLQGKIERSDVIENEFRPLAISFFQDQYKGSKTSVFFENNTKNERNINVEYDYEKEKILYKTSRGLNPFFRIAPIVLRRSDIINYSNTPTIKKQILFWSFIYNTEKLNPTEISNESLDKKNMFFANQLDNELLHLKNLRRSKLNEIANNLKISLDLIPTVGTNSFNQFVKEIIKKNLSNNQLNELKKRGKISGINFDNLILVEDIDNISVEIKNTRTKISELKDSTDSPSLDNKKIKIKNFLKEASKSLTDSFKKISTVDFVKEISLSIGEKTEVSFEIFITLNNGKITTPSNIFSEANLDLLILLLFTSLIKEAEKHGQSKIIILDDVLQSVDSTIRLNFIDYLANDFKDWQIIITAHDKLWLNQIKSCFKRKQLLFKEIEINKWDFETGPQITELESNEDSNSLEIALKTNNSQIIASQSGLFLETICQKLSMSLNISIQRRLDDKYTIGDLWPGIKKYFKSSELLQEINEIDKYLFIRNLIGAHYNEWALSISNQEVVNFANFINDLYKKTYCTKCQNWLQMKGSCPCGNLNK
jgi:recombinational DNA repair ATPase RecF